MKVVALLFVIVLLRFHADAQTIDDIIQFIFDHSSDCGDPFSDPVWVPALDLCTIGCDTLGEICMEDADLNQRCDLLPDKCTTGLKKKYPNAIGKKTKPHATSKPHPSPAPGTEAPGEPPVEEETDAPAGPGAEEEYGQTSTAPEEETATEAPAEETEAPLPETEAPVVATEGPQPPVEPSPYPQPAPQPQPQPQPPPQPYPQPAPQPQPQPQPQPGGYGSGGPSAPGGNGATGGSQGGARDYHTWCCKWAFEGHCNARPVLMRPLCQKSCGTVGCRAENALTCPVTVNVSPETCWQLRGKSGNPDRDATHFRPQPGAVAQPYTVDEIGAPVPKPQPQSRPPPNAHSQPQSQSYQQPAAPQPAAPQPAAPQPAPALPPPPQPSASYQQPSPPQQPPALPPPPPQPQSYSGPVPEPEPKPQPAGGYRQRWLLHRRFVLLRRLYSLYRH